MPEMRDAIIFVRFWRPPMPPIPLTPQYLTILMTEGVGITFCRILAPPNAPPPMTPQYLTILMTERSGAIIVYRILAPLYAPPPSPQTPQYLTILMTEGAPFSFVGFWRTPPPPPPSPFPRRHNTY